MMCTVSAANAFAVRTIEHVGAKHTPKEDHERITKQNVGLNLFQMDIDRVQRDLKVDVECPFARAAQVRQGQRILPGTVHPERLQRLQRYDPGRDRRAEVLR